MASGWSGRKGVGGDRVLTEPDGAEIVGDEDVPPQVDEGDDQRFVDMGLAASVCI